MTKLGALNFFLLQWFTVRLVYVTDGPFAIAPGSLGRWRTRYELWFGVIPLTGWWSDYERVGRVAYKSKWQYHE